MKNRVKRALSIAMIIITALSNSSFAIASDSVSQNSVDTILENTDSNPESQMTVSENNESQQINTETISQNESLLNEVSENEVTVSENITVSQNELSVSENEVVVSQNEVAYIESIYETLNGKEFRVTGRIPTGSELIVSTVTTPIETIETIETLTSATVNQCESYDISILLNGEQFQPYEIDQRVIVTITNINIDSTITKVFHTDDNQTIEDMNGTLIDNEVQFMTDHFSIYTIAGIDYNTDLSIEYSDIYFTSYYFTDTKTLLITEIVDDSAFSSLWDGIKNEVQHLVIESEIGPCFAQFANYTELETIEMYGVTDLLPSVFMGCTKLESVIADDVTTVGYQAFMDCTALNNVSMGNVISIGQLTFRNCTSLLDVNFPNLETMGTQAFSLCGNIKNMSLPKLLSIRDSEFYFNPLLETINLASAESIGKWAFSNCELLETADITSVKYISEQAFYDCSLLNISSTPNLISVDTGAFGNCKMITSMESDLLTSIGVSAFYGCTSLQNVNSPNLLTLGAFAFSDCEMLESVNIDMVVSVANGVFSGCSSLNTINLDSVESVGEASFENCTSLNILEAQNLITIGDSAFEGCTSLTTVNSNALSSIGHSSFADCTNLALIDCEKVESIGKYAFSNCESLVEMYPPLLTTIDDYTFSGCTSLETMASPLIESVGNSAFQGCKLLTDANFTLLESIGNSGFAGCESIIVADFPLISYLGDNSFYGCKSLTTVNMPNLILLNDGVFTNCESLESIDLEFVESIGSYTFSGCIKLKTVNTPALNSVGSYGFENCESLETINFPLLDYIDFGAFDSCVKLREIDLNMIEYIESYAFNNCKSLTKIHLGSDAYLNSSAFLKCDNLIEIEIDNYFNSILDGDYVNNEDIFKLETFEIMPEDMFENHEQYLEYLEYLEAYLLENQGSFDIDTDSDGAADMKKILINISGDNEFSYYNWEADGRVPSYKVEFDSASGTESTSQLIAQDYIDFVIEPINVIKSGFILSGWYTDNDYSTEWDFNSGVVTEDMQLYAKWIPEQSAPVVTEDSSNNTLPTIEDSSDKTSPTINLKANTITLTNKAVTITAIASDNLNKVAYIKLPNNEKIYSANASFTVYSNDDYLFKVYDTDGNYSTKIIAINNIDTVKPNIKATNSLKWSKNNSEITIDASDNAGVAFITTPDNIEHAAESLKYIVNSNGKYLFKVTDAAGNISMVETIITTIDTTIPSISLHLKNIIWNTGLNTIIITASDSDSGLNIMPYSVDNGKTWFNSDYTIETGGYYTILVRDRAGNTNSEIINALKEIKEDGSIDVDTSETSQNIIEPVETEDTSQNIVETASNNANTSPSVNEMQEIQTSDDAIEIVETAIEVTVTPKYTTPMQKFIADKIKHLFKIMDIEEPKQQDILFFINLFQLIFILLLLLLVYIKYNKYKVFMIVGSEETRLKKGLIKKKDAIYIINIINKKALSKSITYRIKIGKTFSKINNSKELKVTINDTDSLIIIDKANKVFDIILEQN